MTAPADTGLHGQEHEPVPAEDVPTGLFGRSAYRLPAHITPWTVAEQTDHLAVLEAEMSQVVVGDLIRRHKRQPNQRQGAA